MNQARVKELCREIKYELADGTHTFTMCECGRHGCRGSRCWECSLDILYYNKIDAIKQNQEEVKKNEF